MSEFHGGQQGPRHQQQGPFVPPQPSGLPPYHQAPKPPKKPMSKEARIGWLILGGVVALLVGVAIGAGGNDSTSTTSSTPQPTVTKTVAGPAGAEVTVTPPPVTVTKTVPGPKVTVTAQPPGPAAVMSEDGIYLVGVDIKPGTYRSGPDESCYWARLSNTSGDLDGIIANHNGGNSIVTIKRTDKAFETSGCGEWKKVG